MSTIISSSISSLCLEPMTRPARPETEPGEIQAFVRLVRASSTVTRELSAQLQADHDLTLNTYEALLTLARAPDRRMRRVDLANSLAADRRRRHAPARRPRARRLRRA